MRSNLPFPHFCSPHHLRSSTLVHTRIFSLPIMYTRASRPNHGIWYSYWAIFLCLSICVPLPLSTTVSTSKQSPKHPAIRLRGFTLLSASPPPPMCIAKDKWDFFFAPFLHNALRSVFADEHGRFQKREQLIAIGTSGLRPTFLPNALIGTKKGPPPIDRE